MKAVLVGRGTMFHGESIGAQGTCIERLCLYRMTYYQEVLTDPISRRTGGSDYPIVGNYGANPRTRNQTKYILRLYSQRVVMTSNLDAITLDEYLKRIVLSAFRLTHFLNQNTEIRNSMKVISTQSDFKLEDWIDMLSLISLLILLMFTSKEAGL